jgi:tetratricopeptide (TPR) repeat protein
MAENNLSEIIDPNIYIWLDDSIENNVASRELKTQIRQMVKGRLQTFADPEKCADYITDITTQKIFLIVSNRFGQYVIPLIHDIPQIDTVYVYCGNRLAAESWAKPYSKVRGIFISKQSLLQKIAESVDAGGKDEDLPMSVFRFATQENSLKKLSEQCTKFMWYQAILTVLLFMAKYFNAKDDMIIASRACYQDNNAQKQKIDEFEQTYTPETAVLWYTYDSFVYRILNRALRTQDIDIIFKFRFFINDLHNQIQNLYRKYLTNHKESHLTFYRGQKMSMDEVELLKNSINGLISMNSFLSTTSTPGVAEPYIGADGPSDEASSLQSVLFIIDVCDIDQDTTAFAFIKTHSCFEEEDEVLFTIGAIFKVESVKKEKNIWHIHLKLSKQKQNQQHKEFADSMMKQLGPQPGPTAFGWFLYKMPDFNGAIGYAKYILKQLSMENTEIGDAYNLLGLIYKDLNRLEESVECYDKALEACSRSSCNNSAQVISIHYNASLAYLAMGDNRLAEDHRRKVDSLLINSSCNNNPLIIAMTESLKAKLQTAHGNFENAFKILEVALAEKRKGYPPKHPALASTLNDMGIVQEKMGHDEKALEYFKQALDCCDCLTADHPDSVEYHTNIGRIYYKREQYELALEQFESAYKIMIEYRLDDSENFVIIMKCISDINDQLYPRST